MMQNEIPKSYNPKEVEEKWYKVWEESGYFVPSPKSNIAFTIVIPPPNVTGSLHMGHALDNTLQDILIRYHRMKGDKTLWVPGTDHAGIATQNVVEKELKKQGKRKEDLGREKFVEKVWEWKKEYGGRITQQLRRLGASCDWSRERFTMDEGLSRAVKKAFLTLYDEGLIYKGKRLINWCPRCQTALSDVEVEHETTHGKLWFIKYPTTDHRQQTTDFVVVATTRPETMLGDTAVAVNPNDERYKHLIGKMLTLPLVGRQIPIIKDEAVDPQFGTGAVKVTPAHDTNDFEMGLRHNLPQINMLYPFGKVATKHFEEQAAHKYDGIERFKARDLIVEDLKAGGFLEKIEDYETNIGHCYRCKTIIEPYLSDQWFVKVKPLAEAAIAAVEEGKIKFVPERWTKVYINWMVNLKDWCISRQIWWGHKIPLDGEEDVLDTWFSSSLWPFSTLGWPDQTEDLKTFYPTSVLVTGYDIITFWVSRMIMMGMHFTKEAPFQTVFIHGLIRDVTGKKMSKSLGNVIDPLDVIEHAGADALRFALTSLITGQGQDIKLSEDKIREAKSFANKVWNAARFALSQKSDVSGQLSMADKWILSRYNQRVKQITEHIENFDLGQAARDLYDFVWGEFCDWYIEMSKVQDTSNILIQVLEGTLRLLHPFMPFITEELWSRVTGFESRVDMTPDPRPQTQDSIMFQEWPKADEKLIDEKIEAEMSYIMEIIRQIRNLRAEKKIENKAEIKVDIQVDDENKKQIIAEAKKYILKLARASEVEIRIGEGKISILNF